MRKDVLLLDVVIAMRTVHCVAQDGNGKLLPVDTRQLSRHDVVQRSFKCGQRLRWI